MSKRKRTSGSPVKLQCTKCPYETALRGDWWRHFRRHETANVFCDVCNMPFMTVGHLGGHKLREHGIEKSKPVVRKFCTLCDFSTLHYGDMSSHRRKHESAEFTCRYCNFPFCHPKPFIIHMKKSHGKDGETELQIQSKKLKNKHKKIKIEHEHHKIKHSKNTNGLAVPSTEKRLSNDKPPIVERKYQQTNSRINKSLMHIANYGNHCDENGKDTTTTASISESRSSIHSNKKRKEVSTENHSNVTVQRSLRTSGKRKSMDDNQRCCTEQIYQCANCVFRTRQFTVFERHTQRHGKAKYNCGTCDMPFIFKANFEKHSKNKHGNKQSARLKSTFLSNDTKTNKNISHKNKTNNGLSKRIKCAFCDFSTHSFIKLKQHLDRHDVTEISDETDTQEELSNVNTPDVSDKSNPIAIDENISSSETDEDVYDQSREETTLFGIHIPSRDKHLYNVTSATKQDECLSAHSNIIKEENDTIRFKSKMHFEIPNENIKLERIHQNRGSEDYDEETYPNEERLNVLPYACPSCYFETERKQDLKIHLASHLEDHPISKRLYGNYKDGVNQNKQQSKSFLQKVAENAKMITDEIGKKQSVLKKTTKFSKKKSECIKIKKEYINDDLKNAETGKLDESNTGCLPDTTLNYDEMKCNLAESEEKGTKYNSYPEGLKNTWAVNGIDKNISKTENEGEVGCDNRKSVRGLTGKITKNDFKRSRRLFTKHVVNGNYIYECLICETGNKLETLHEIWSHFRLSHKKLRQKICDTCAFCSAPFPRMIRKTKHH